MKTTAAANALTVDSVTWCNEHVCIMATNAKGERLEFTSHKGGAVEAYDYPKSWNGIPRSIGYLPAKAAAMVGALAIRSGLVKCNKDDACRHLYDMKRDDVIALFVQAWGGNTRATQSYIAPDFNCDKVWQFASQLRANRLAA